MSIRTTAKPADFQKNKTNRSSHVLATCWADWMSAHVTDKASVKKGDNGLADYDYDNNSTEKAN
jgi:hypothetical protein